MLQGNFQTKTYIPIHLQYNVQALQITLVGRESKIF